MGLRCSRRIPAIGRNSTTFSEAPNSRSGLPQAGSITLPASTISIATTNSIPTGILRASSISLRTKLTASTAPESSTRETIPNELGLTRRLAIAWRTKTDSWETCDYPPQTHGQRLNNEAYAQQQLVLGRFDLIAGARFIHNSAFGNTGVPRVAVAWQALRGGRKVFRNAPALLLRDRIQRTAAGRDLRRSSVHASQYGPEARALALFRGRTAAEFSAGPVRLHHHLFQQSFSRPDQLCDRRSRELHWRIQQREPGAGSWRGSGAASEAALAAAAEHGLHLYVNANPGESRAHQRSLQSGPAAAPAPEAFGDCSAVLSRVAVGRKCLAEASWDAAPTPIFWVSTSITPPDTFAPM